VNPEENPYAAPQASALTSADPREGALWYVSEGVLHVRDGASLPDVCLAGASPSEAGERKALDIAWSPAWGRHLPSVAYLAAMAWVVILFGAWEEAPSFDSQYRGFIAIMVAIVLLTLLARRVAKRGSLHVFQSNQATRNESRRGLIEGATVFAFVVGGGALLSGMFPGFLSKGGVVVLIGVPSTLLGILERRGRVRACQFTSGWFALANVDQAAIARLAEIQSRINKPPLSRKPS
jgi:hypothetical protein